VSERRRVLVVGGGLAGITAALDCAQAGASVTLLEVRRRLGGAAYSFEREGLVMDNGQHVFLRCCAAYRTLLARLGSERSVSVQDRLDIPVLSPGRPPVRLRRSTLPAPFHLAWTLARYRHLRPLERLAAARAALALARLRGEGEHGDLALGEWLAAHGQGPEAIAALWDLIALPTLNIAAARASLKLGAFVFRTGLLAHASAGDIGFHVRPLQEAIGDPALRALREAGVEVKLGVRAERLSAAHGELAVSCGEEERSADAVILALAHGRAAALLEPVLPRLAGRISQIGSSPIVNLHVVYDRRVCELAFAAGVNTPVQYVFDRTTAAGAAPGCQYLAISLSGAQREMALSVDELRELYLPALQELFPVARRARVELFLATREHAATFLAAPGVGALRPGPRTPLAGLLLAGSWTATGWPATLEGAVLSGHEAARAALAQLGLQDAQGRAQSALADALPAAGGS
jgi:squalene-associated FAD-dependent desaturase